VSAKVESQREGRRRYRGDLPCFESAERRAIDKQVHMKFGHRSYMLSPLSKHKAACCRFIVPRGSHRQNNGHTSRVLRFERGEDIEGVFFRLRARGSQSWTDPHVYFERRESIGISPVIL
jgi:hypothetical protein